VGGWAPGPVWTERKISPPQGRPACGESLYRLSYPSPHLFATVYYLCHKDSNILEYKVVSTG